MNYFDVNFLTEQSRAILDFYEQRVVDPDGGFFQNFYDDGRIFDAKVRHLVSSTRIIVNFSSAAKQLDRPDYLDIARHGMNYLEDVHWQASTQTYAWTLSDNQPVDQTQQSYGYAFVLLAYAALKKAGVISSSEKLMQTFDLMEQRFFLAEHGLYADEISANGILSDYRGQNANMHICEAMISAYEATSDSKFLDRAQLIATNIAFRQADLSDGIIWEHYSNTFQIDWDYNQEDPKNLYRPWGFQPGHQTEWAKLLLQLNVHAPSNKWVDKAKMLIDWAIDTSWDDTFGGLVYGVDPNGVWCDEDKYFWVQAESFAAAAMLYQVTNDTAYLNFYQRLWQYCEQHFVDHQHGAWFRVLTRQNQKYDEQKSRVGAKCDYHNLLACFEVMKAMRTVHSDALEQPTTDCLRHHQAM